MKTKKELEYCIKELGCGMHDCSVCNMNKELLIQLDDVLELIDEMKKWEVNGFYIYAEKLKARITG